MPRALRRVTAAQFTSLELAVASLRTARRHLTRAGAIQARRAAHRAVKSTEGALRHAERAYYRS